MVFKGPGYAFGSRDRGFVLAMTLWFLAGIAVVVGLVTLWSLERVRDATEDREQTEDEIAMISTRDTFVYLAATRVQTLAGLPIEPLADDDRAARVLMEFGDMDLSPRGDELRLDGRTYQGSGYVAFALQDEAGLFPLGWPDDLQLDLFLATHGVPREQRAALRDALLDYVDLDDLRRLHGAESREYERLGMPVPPNRRLLLPHEIGRVVGWSSLPPSLRERMQEVSTTFQIGAVNLNTMPAELLPGWLPGCPETCEAFLARREVQPFHSSADVRTILGVSLPGEDGFDYRYGASGTVRLTLWGRTGMAHRIHVELTPLADQRAPWRVLAAYPVSRPHSHAAPQPTHSPLFTDSPVGQ